MTDAAASGRQARRAGPAAPRRGTWRRTWLGLQTALGLAQRGFFIPHRHADSTIPAGHRQSYQAVEALFEARRPVFAALLDALERWRAPLLAIGGRPAPAPRWDQDWFPRLDAAAAYAMVRQARPRRIVEVGSGHSTRFVLQALADDARSGDCAVTAIDPAPRAPLEAAARQTEAFTLIRRPLQAVGLEPFRDLAAGDILMIDSSHVLMPGSDVDLLLGHVVPGLAAGVLLQIHDIFLPDDYPVAWAWRGYNEQLAVLPLLSGGAWEPLFASHYVASRMGEAVAGSLAGALPLSPGAFESALWLRKREAPAAFTSP